MLCSIPTRAYGADYSASGWTPGVSVHHGLFRREAVVPFSGGGNFCCLVSDDVTCPFLCLLAFCTSSLVNCLSTYLPIFKLRVCHFIIDLQVFFI